MKLPFSYCKLIAGWPAEIQHFAPKKLCSGRTVNHAETCIALDLIAAGNPIQYIVQGFAFNNLEGFIEIAIPQKKNQPANLTGLVFSVLMKDKTYLGTCD